MDNIPPSSNLSPVPLVDAAQLDRRSTSKRSSGLCSAAEASVQQEHLSEPRRLALVVFAVLRVKRRQTIRQKHVKMNYAQASSGEWATVMKTEVFCIYTEGANYEVD